MNDLPSKNEVALIVLHALLSKQKAPTDLVEQCFMVAEAFLQEAEALKEQEDGAE